LAQQRKVKELKKTLGSRWRGEEGCEDLVFVTTMGCPDLRYHAEKEIKKVVKEINLQESVQAVREQREPVAFEDMYPHAIRHTFCSRCFEADVSDIRAEDGNIRYEYFFPMDDKETVLLIDSWKDQHSIDVHHASPMMAKIIELREKYGLHMRVERYVSDETGVPAADKAFIKE